MVISELLSKTEKDLKGIENAAFEAAQLVGYVLKMSPCELF